MLSGGNIIGYLTGVNINIVFTLNMDVVFMDTVGVINASSIKIIFAILIFYLSYVQF
jgi:hypothetical protein